MNTRLTLLAAALAISPVAAASVSLPTYETYSAAENTGTNFFSTTFVPQTDITNVANAMARISGSDYSASARTTLGINHAYASVSSLPSGTLGVRSFSGWYDQITISGGTGTGSVQFSVQLNGTVTAGAYLGVVGYGLLASSLHPTQLIDSLNIIGPVSTPAQPWALYSDQVTEIALYDVVASPYNDPNQVISLFPPAPTPPGEGIPAITDPNLTLGDANMGFPEYVPDLILTPGVNQAVNVTLTGTLTFTYGEAFYLIGTLGALAGDGLNAFCVFGVSTECTPTPKDGIGVTTLDFANSAHLTSILLPQGASFASASGAAYNITAVPEPGEWLMLLAGLGLVGWRVRQRG
jgi:hypothetical protein